MDLNNKEHQKLYDWFQTSFPDYVLNCSEQGEVTVLNVNNLVLSLFADGSINYVFIKDSGYIRNFYETTKVDADKIIEKLNILLIENMND